MKRFVAGRPSMRCRETMAKRGGNKKRGIRVTPAPRQADGTSVRWAPISANSPLIDETLRVWQPHYAVELTREDAREILENVTGAFALLLQWEKAEAEAGRARQGLSAQQVGPRSK